MMMKFKFGIKNINKIIIIVERDAINASANFTESLPEARAFFSNFSGCSLSFSISIISFII